MNVSTTTLINTNAKVESNPETLLFNRATRSLILAEGGRMYMDRVGPALHDDRSAFEALRFYNVGLLDIARQCNREWRKYCLLPVTTSLMSRACTQAIIYYGHASLD